MADISDINSAQTVKVVGADATGVEQTPVQSTANGGLHINLRNLAGTEVGTVASPLKIDVLTVPTATLALEAKQDTTITNLNTLITNTGTPFVDSTSSGTITVLGGTVTQTCQGRQTAIIEITGTWTGTLVIEGLGPSGAYYQLVSYTIPVTAGDTYPATSSITGNGRYYVNCAGNTSIRVRASAAMTGTANIYFDITVGNFITIVQQAGSLAVTSTPIESTRSTWSAAITGLVPAATPTDIFQFYGVASKVIRILRIEITATQTTAAVRDILLIKRTTATTGGTSTSLTPVAHNINNVTVTPSVKAYTVNPTSLGTGTTVRAFKALINTTTTTVYPIVWEFATRPAQAMELRSATDAICINLNSITSAGNLFNISIEWTEV